MSNTQTIDFDTLAETLLALIPKGGCLRPIDSSTCEFLPDAVFAKPKLDRPAIMLAGTAWELRDDDEVRRVTPWAGDIDPRLGDLDRLTIPADFEVCKWHGGGLFVPFAFDAWPPKHHIPDIATMLRAALTP